MGFLFLALAGVLALIFFGVPALYTLVTSFKEFSPMRGLWGSPFVGLQNYVRLFADAKFGLLLCNSLVLSLLGGIVPLLPAFLRDGGRPRRPDGFPGPWPGFCFSPPFCQGFLIPFSW